MIFTIEIRRGSTPTLEFETETELSEFSQIYVVIKQETGDGYVCIEKTLTDDGVSEDNKHFSVRLTQEETLCLNDSRKAELQLKGKTVYGDVMTTDIMELSIRRVLHEEVI